MSRFGDISPAFAAAYGASVDVGLMLGSRNAQARSFAGAVRVPRDASRHATLPVEIPTVRPLPASRVHTAIVAAARR